MIIVEKPTDELILLQQPISHENYVVLDKVCKEVDIKVYATPYLKCVTDKANKEEVSQCFQHLVSEALFIQPKKTIVCGNEAEKWFKKCSLNTPYIKLHSLSKLFMGKPGINQMKRTLQILKDLYV